MLKTGFLLLLAAGITPAAAAPGPDLTRLLNETPSLSALAPAAGCIRNVVQHYRLDLGVFLAVLATEGGKPGDRNLNRNGTYDFGPAQINSSWISRFRKRGIPVTDDLLQNHTCFNLFASGWILRYELDRAPDLWTGIGRYHSRTPKYQKRYIRKVYRRWRDIYRRAREMAGGGR